MPPTLTRIASGLRTLSRLCVTAVTRALLLNDLSDKPLRVAVSRDPFEEPTILRIYAWNVTHGGGSARSVDEFQSS